jgi:hypothetical protein
MSQKRSTRRLLSCAALSAGVLLGSGAASAEAPRPTSAPARSPLAALLDAALKIASASTGETRPDNFVELQPRRRMGNTKGPGYTDRAACDTVDRAQPVQARTPRRTSRRAVR